MKYPEIRIKNGWLLREHTSVHLHELWGKKDEKLASDEEIDEIVMAYQKAWSPYEKKILQGMCDTFGLTFRQNAIDVYIAPWFHAFSDPMVIGVTYQPDRFIEVLTHELLHRLLTDNNETAYGTRYATEWAKLFGDDHTFTTLIHIPVHAGMQAIFDDVVGEPERTQNDISKCEKYEDYKKAWVYVQSNSYQEIVNDLKKQYESTPRLL